MSSAGATQALRLVGNQLCTICFGQRIRGRGKKKMINIKMIISFLNKIEKLKCITRHSWTSDGRKESVAEHSWRLAIMIYLLQDELKGCNVDKMVTMALFHDISEVKFGDVPGFNKTKKDVEKEKKVLEEISEEYKELGINQIIDVVK